MISSVAQITSGVPQGSVIGPLLFSVLINNLSLVVSSTSGLFTDDTYIYWVIKSKEDSTALQRDLDALVKWEQTWSIKFHPDKWKVLTITNKSKIFRFDYKIHNKCLEKVDHAKYLGVHIDKKLLWKFHVSSITSTTNHCRHFFQQHLVICDQETKLQCYKRLACPIVEYTFSVWDPTGNKQLQYQLEQVKKKAARWTELNWDYKSSASNIAHNLGLNSVAARREIVHLKMLHSIYYN